MTEINTSSSTLTVPDGTRRDQAVAGEQITVGEYLARRLLQFGGSHLRIARRFQRPTRITVIQWHIQPTAVKHLVAATPMNLLRFGRSNGSAVSQ